MAEQELDFDDMERRMKGAASALNNDLAGLRTGRASASLLDPVMVDAYGQNMSVAQVGTVGVPEARMITVQVWDNGLVSAVEKAIRQSGLGLNPATDGQLIRIPVPQLNEERRKELSKIAAKYAEQGRVAIRNIRRDGMEELKKLEKNGEISKDEHKTSADQVQKMTDQYVAMVDATLLAKEKEIMQV